MSDLLEKCHIDKGTYTDGPVLTADIRALFNRIAELEKKLAVAVEVGRELRRASAYHYRIDGNYYGKRLQALEAEQ